MLLELPNQPPLRQGFRDLQHSVPQDVVGDVPVGAPLILAPMWMWRRWATWEMRVMHTERRVGLPPFDFGKHLTRLRVEVVR